jgi:hypothetical protein
MFTNDGKDRRRVLYCVEREQKQLDNCCYTKLQARADGDVLFTCQRVPGR